MPFAMLAAVALSCGAPCTAPAALRAVAAVAAAPIPAPSAVQPRARVWFSGLGTLPWWPPSSRAADASRSCLHVTGSSSYYSDFGSQAYRWVTEVGMSGLGELDGGTLLSDGFGISPDGLFVVGGSASARGYEAFLWSAAAGRMIALGSLPGPAFGSTAFDVSTGGRVVIGNSRSERAHSSGWEAFRWTPETGMAGLGFLPGGRFASSEARAVSGDGTIIVGWSSSTPGTQAFRWTMATGMVGLGDLPGGPFYESSANAISDNGRFIVGASQSALGNEGYIWSERTGMVPLGFLPGGDPASFPAAVSDDGQVVVGIANYEATPFIWRRGLGMKRAAEVFREHGLDVEAMGWTLGSVTAVSADGRTMVGGGRNPQGHGEGWIAHFGTWPTTTEPAR